MKVETKAKVKIENDAEHQNAILTVMNKLRKKHQHHGVFSSAPRLTYTHTHTHTELVDSMANYRVFRQNSTPTMRMFRNPNYDRQRL